MADGTCAVEGCDKAGPLKRGWCGGHYRRWQRTGDLGSAEVGRKPTVAKCSVDGCERTVSCRALCKAHLHRLIRYGDVQADKPVQSHRKPGTAGTCTVDPCGVSATGRYCAGHAGRLRTKGDLQTHVPLRRRGVPKPSVPCSVDGCGRAAKTVGLCGGHYTRWNRTGNSGSAEIRPIRAKAEPGSTCAVSGCGRATRSLGWCHSHYSRWQRSGDIRPDEPIAVPLAEQPQKSCVIGGCARPYYGKSWCFVHYQRWWRHGNPVAQQPFRILNLRGKGARARHRDMMAKTTKSDRRIARAYRQAISKDPCIYCGGPSSHGDHYYPVSRGGTYLWWALVPACAKCNQTKNARCGTWFALRGGSDRIARTFPRALVAA